ncbi:hypothetical protein ACNJC6_02862 [Acinetobacter johnsonii]|uniref:Putative phage metallopeptidase domain-containing protein n=1 Tax=Acinetobacter johnsonii TaxID=40214 RepID=A0A1R7QGA9_ACIJO|nr:hypothetical protein ACNJC6_02862 [Acinetobacter johnsonii]
MIGCVRVYLITLYVSFCNLASDHDFGALIEHEFNHIGSEWDQDDEIIILAYLDIIELDMTLKSSIV